VKFPVIPKGRLKPENAASNEIRRDVVIVSENQPWGGCDFSQFLLFAPRIKKSAEFHANPLVVVNVVVSTGKALRR